MQDSQGLILALTSRKNAVNTFNCSLFARQRNSIPRFGVYRCANRDRVVVNFLGKKLFEAIFEIKSGSRRCANPDRVAPASISVASLLLLEDSPTNSPRVSYKRGTSVCVFLISDVPQYVCFL